MARATKPKTTKLDLAAAVRASVAAWLAEPEGVAVAAAQQPPDLWPRPTGIEGDAFGQMIFNTGAFRADGLVQQAVVTNDSGRTAWLTYAEVWLGVSAGGVCDAHGQLTRNDGSTLAVGQFDHYAPASDGAGCKQVVFARPFCLPPGWKLALTYFVNAFGNRAVYGHFTVTVQGYYQ